MIVVGVDPGARETGVAIVDTSGGSVRALPKLLGSATIRSAKPPLDRGLVIVTDDYLEGVTAAIRGALGEPGDLPALLAVEGVTAPTGFARGQRHSIDPAPLIAVGIVYGAIRGRSWRVPLVTVRPGANGTRPFGTYPEALVSAAERRAGDWQLRKAGDGQLRHERSAYDVAVQGPRALSLARSGR